MYNVLDIKRFRSIKVEHVRRRNKIPRTNKHMILVSPGTDIANVPVNSTIKLSGNVYEIFIDDEQENIKNIAKTLDAIAYV